ncbi:hypothetical protein QZH41_003651 [Actinostola sp. cb2023]|nr:hypothetical protein QZH41_003651 [Actinostola sp. cb2023]
MRLMKYRFTIVHVPGKDLTSADTLSRAPTTEPVAKDYALEEDGNLYVNLIVNGLPASEKRLDEIRVHLHEDEVDKIGVFERNNPEYRINVYGYEKELYPLRINITKDINAKFDTSAYPKNHAGIKNFVNKKVIGMMKDETAGNEIVEFVGLRAKLYAYKIDNIEVKRCKGVKRYVVKNGSTQVVTITVDRSPIVTDRHNFDHPRAAGLPEMNMHAYDQIPET